jgi:hypothetical protein
MNDLSWVTEHGKAMYISGLQHAINMFEIAGEDALPILKERLAEEEAELTEPKGE